MQEIAVTQIMPSRLSESHFTVGAVERCKGTVQRCVDPEILSPRNQINFKGNPFNGGAKYTRVKNTISVVYPLLQLFDNFADESVK